MQDAQKDSSKQDWGNTSDILGMISQRNYQDYTLVNLAIASMTFKPLALNKSGARILSLSKRGSTNISSYLTPIGEDSTRNLSLASVGL